MQSRYPCPQWMSFCATIVTVVNTSILHRTSHLHRHVCLTWLCSQSWTWQSPRVWLSTSSYLRSYPSWLRNRLLLACADLGGLTSHLHGFNFDRAGTVLASDMHLSLSVLCQEFPINFNFLKHCPSILSMCNACVKRSKLPTERVQKITEIYTQKSNEMHISKWAKGR